MPMYFGTKFYWTNKENINMFFRGKKENKTFLTNKEAIAREYILFIFKSVGYNL